MVRIDYNGESPSAPYNFAATVAVGDIYSGSDLDLIHDRRAKLLSYGNPCEQYAVALDGTTLPYQHDDSKIAWWSNQISDSEGYFETPITLMLEADKLYNATGITLIFDTENNLYATELDVTWYNGAEMIQSKKFYPDSPKYYCENTVNGFNKVKITFYKTNIGYNRIHLNALYYGILKQFSGQDLTNVKIIRQASPIATEVQISTADIGLRVTGDIKYDFMNNQSLDIYFDDDLVSTQFISETKRKTRTDFEIKTEDYIGILANTVLPGGFLENTNACEALKDIFELANVPYTIDPTFENTTLTGFVPYTNCREALQQVVFAIQGIVDCSIPGRVFIKPSPINVGNANSQIIEKTRIMQGGSVESEIAPTAIEIVSHEYIKTAEEETIFEAQTAVEGETLITFSEPYYDFYCEGEAQIVEAGWSYAKITNYKAGFVLKGKKIKHVQTAKRLTSPNWLGTNIEKTISIKNATLVNANNIDNILKMCYNYYTNTGILKSNIVERKHDDGTTDNRINLYDEIQCETEYSGKFRGIVTKQTFNLNSSIIVKETEARGASDDI